MSAPSETSSGSDGAAAATAAGAGAAPAGTVPTAIGVAPPAPAPGSETAGAASTPSTGPRITQALPPASASARGDLGWEDLSALRGQRVRLWTQHNPPRVVNVLSVEGEQMRISTRVGGGIAEYTVHRAAFLKARAIR